jgi:putative hydrolase of the HAD superfamily
VSAAVSAPAVSIVWCDYGGVMTPPVTDATARIEAATGIPWAEIAAASDRVSAAMSLRGLGPLERGLITQLEWGRRVSAELPPALRPADDLAGFADQWNSGRLPEVALLDELDRIRDAGVRVGMLTNSVAEWEPYRRELLRGRRELDAALRSHETGLAKPDEAIFVRADEMLPPGGGAVVLIDDMEVNCAAAVAHGWLAIHHRDAASTVARLRELVPARAGASPA